MSTAVNRIKSLISTLPDKDVSLGYKFLNNRDFESLKELVDSAIKKVLIYRRRPTTQDKYINVSLDDLNVLKAEVDSYLIQIDPDSDEFSEFENELIEENYY